MRHLRLVPSLILLALPLAAGCGDTVRIPAPSSAGTARPIPQAEASVVNLPVTVSLDAVAAQVERRIPHGQNREAQWQEIGRFPVVGTLFVKEMWERGPLRLNINGDHLDVAATVRYRARIAGHPCLPFGGGCRYVQLGSCGVDQPMPSVEVALRTTLTLRDDWSVAPRTRPRAVRTPVACKLTQAHVDVTERVRGMVENLLSSSAPQIDARIREAAALRRRVESVWATVQEPIKATDGVYVMMQPEALSATPPVGSGTTLSTTVSVVVRPRVVIGDRPVVAARPLPNRVPAQAGTGFRIQLVAELPFEAANELLDKNLEHRAFRAKGHTIKVRGLRLYPGGDRVVLAADVTGDARGTLYFVGTPVFDPQSQVVSVPDLDFSVESRDVLPQVAGWLLYDDLRDQLRHAARFPVGDRVTSIREDVTEALNRQLSRGVSMTGSVEQLRPLGVFVFAKSLASVVEAEGQARIRVEVGAPRTPRPPAADSSAPRGAP